MSVGRATPRGLSPVTDDDDDDDDENEKQKNDHFMSRRRACAHDIRLTRNSEEFTGGR